MRNRSSFQVGAACALVVFATAVGARAQPARPLELEDFFRLKRVADSQIAPDGKRVVYVVTEVLKDENRQQRPLAGECRGGARTSRAN